jgi:hypothetical protein
MTRYRFAAPGTVLAAALTLGLIASATSSDAWAQSASKSRYKAPRTTDGHPDLQGVWTNATITPFERPDKFGDRLVLTDAEAHALESAEASAVAKGNEPTDPKLGIQDLPVDCGRGFSGTGCGYNGFWIDPGTHVMTINGEKRSSMVVDPPNGKVPPLAPQARERMASRTAAFRRGGGGGSAYDGPEARPLGERCIMSFGSSAGPPMLPLLYNNNYQIVQSGDTVTILVEMVHDVRTVRLGGEHLPPSIRPWMGDSIGRWEGETLIVETTNFHPQQSYRGASENLKVIERFTRVAPNQILYRFTIEDPTTFSQPWSAEVAMNATDQKIYEYACHEGNYALPGILAGAREAERAAAEAAATKK